MGRVVVPMAAHVGGVREMTAAEILVSFRNRELVRWPEWVPRPDEEPAAEEDEEKEEEEVYFDRLKWSNRRPRRPLRMPAPPSVWGKRKLFKGLEPPRNHGGEDAQAPLPPPARERMMVNVKVKTELKAARRPETPPEYASSAGSSANFSRDGVARSLPRAVVKARVKAEPTAAARMPESPPCYVAASAGSVPSTSGGGGGDRARPRPRPRPSEKAHVKTVPAAGKEAMEASSPETPLDYAAAAGSGTSSSGDDAAQSARKRKAPGAGGSGDASSSGDGGCSCPEKRARLDSTGGGAQTAAAKPEGAKFADAMNRNDEGVLLFDLNDCPDNCEDWS